MKNEKTFRPDRIFSYFRVEWLPLAFVTLSGLIYNIGLLATPWFEGRLAQCLADILSGSETAAQMALLVLAYILVTLLVQASRFIKRFYVRRFANNINRRMKGIANKSSCTLRDFCNERKRGIISLTRYSSFMRSASPLAPAELRGNRLWMRNYAISLRSWYNRGKNFCGKVNTP